MNFRLIYLLFFFLSLLFYYIFVAFSKNNRVITALVFPKFKVVLVVFGLSNRITTGFVLFLFDWLIICCCQSNVKRNNHVINTFALKWNWNYVQDIWHLKDLLNIIYIMFYTIFWSNLDQNEKVLTSYSAQTWHWLSFVTLHDNDL